MSAFNDLIPDRLSRITANLGAAVYLIGTTASIFIGNHEMFQRFGSLGVAAAILFFTDRLLQVELRRQKSVELILHEYGLELSELKDGVSARDIPGKGIETDFRQEEAKFLKLRNHAERINSRNIFLLTIATLQWGFGEVFLNWVTR
ncbi:MAG: hypothetical protein ACU0CA_05720 [Paracoccaceae bacterium]